MAPKNFSKPRRVRLEPVGNDLCIVVDGVKIAKRGHPGTPQARTWISVEPGWTVRDLPRGQIEIRYEGALIN